MIVFALSVPPISRFHFLLNGNEIIRQTFQTNWKSSLFANHPFQRKRETLLRSSTKSKCICIKIAAWPIWRQFPKKCWFAFTNNIDAIYFSFHIPSLVVGLFSCNGTLSPFFGVFVGIFTLYKSNHEQCRRLGKSIVNPKPGMQISWWKVERSK